ncbi:hypothetical protein G6L30_16290 [Agrobacterium rhizogenes]|nr:hypothetical protein [Rhizobium rhizogenes]NTG15111.1 hypothetical protein [Rhizobium rhizogenes]
MGSARSFLAVPAALLVVAILPLPYGYYTFLRCVVTLSAVIVAWSRYKTKGSVNWEVVLMALVAILFNPLVPIWLSRPLWLPIDLLSGGIFIYFAFKKEASVSQ